MQRVNRILENAEYRKLVGRIAQLETDRIFCRHDMDHFLDVARIAALIAEDDHIAVKRDMIYAAALLHDIGRVRQYEDGTEHETAGAETAAAILSACGYSEEETALITGAIASHGDEGVRGQKNLNGLLYRADKISRKCYMCAARDKCHKSADKLIMEIVY